MSSWISDALWKHSTATATLRRSSSPHAASVARGGPGTRRRPGTAASACPPRPASPGRPAPSSVARPRPSDRGQARHGVNHAIHLPVAGRPGRAGGSDPSAGLVDGLPEPVEVHARVRAAVLEQRNRHARAPPRPPCRGTPAPAPTGSSPRRRASIRPVSIRRHDHRASPRRRAPCTPAARPRP